MDPALTVCATAGVLVSGAGAEVEKAPTGGRAVVARPSENMIKSEERGGEGLVEEKSESALNTSKLILLVLIH